MQLITEPNQRDVVSISRDELEQLKAQAAQARSNMVTPSRQQLAPQVVATPHILKEGYWTVKEIKDILGPAKAFIFSDLQKTMQNEFARIEDRNATDKTTGIFFLN